MCIRDRLYPTEVLSALRAMEGKYQFDLIFMDPPYRKGMEQEVLRYLAGSSLLKEDTDVYKRQGRTL